MKSAAHRGGIVSKVREVGQNRKVCDVKTGRYFLLPVNFDRGGRNCSLATAHRFHQSKDSWQSVCSPRTKYGALPCDHHDRTSRDILQM